LKVIISYFIFYVLQGLLIHCRLMKTAHCRLSLARRGRRIVERGLAGNFRSGLLLFLTSCIFAFFGIATLRLLLCKLLKRNLWIPVIRIQIQIRWSEFLFTSRLWNLQEKCFEIWEMNKTSNHRIPKFKDFVLTMYRFREPKPSPAYTSPQFGSWQFFMRNIFTKINSNEKQWWKPHSHAISRSLKN